MDILKKVVAWIVYSSKDPEKMSLTLKGLIPLLVLLKVGDQIQLQGFADTIAHLVVAISDIVLTAITAWGLLRKITYSFSSSTVE